MGSLLQLLLEGGKNYKILAGDRKYLLYKEKILQL